MSDLIGNPEDTFSHDAAQFNFEMYLADRRVAIAIKRSKRLPPIFSCLNRVAVYIYIVPFWAIKYVS